MLFLSIILVGIRWLEFVTKVKTSPRSWLARLSPPQPSIQRAPFLNSPPLYNIILNFRIHSIPFGTHPSLLLKNNRFFPRKIINKWLRINCARWTIRFGKCPMMSAGTPTATGARLPVNSWYTHVLHKYTYTYIYIYI